MSDSNVDDLLCRELVELVTDYLGDALSSEEKARFDRHLLGCPPCTEYLAQMRATIDLTGSLGRTASEPLESSLLDLFRSWSRK
ncbi:MAG: zf-HC2 domain-containing protein [Myxococcales bacterium]